MNFAVCGQVGGGISGLCTAQALVSKHSDVCGKVLVTEARERVGGNITSMSDDSYLWEEGPNSFQPNDAILSMAVRPPTPHRKTNALGSQSAYCIDGKLAFRICGCIESQLIIIHSLPTEAQQVKQGLSCSAIAVQVEAGCDKDLVLGDPTAPRFVYWDKKLRPTPSGPDVLTFDLLTIWGKIRAGLGAAGILKAPRPEGSPARTGLLQSHTPA